MPLLALAYCENRKSFSINSPCSNLKYRFRYMQFLTCYILHNSLSNLFVSVSYSFSVLFFRQNRSSYPVLYTIFTRTFLFRKSIGNHFSIERNNKLRSKTIRAVKSPQSCNPENTMIPIFYKNNPVTVSKYTNMRHSKARYAYLYLFFHLTTGLIMMSILIMEKSVKHYGIKHLQR